VVVDAYKANQKEHKKQFKKKKGLQRGGSLMVHDQGEVADEDPVTLVLTERSIRIVDRIGGDTMFKTLLTDVTFTCAFKAASLNVFAFIASMDQLGSKRCYFFADRTQDGEKLMDLIRQTKKKNDDIYGDATKLQKRNPFKVSNEKREAATGALYNKQIHRGDLQADKLLGAGQFGEVYLAHQYVKSRDGTKKKLKRAVKLLKGEADSKAKQEFMHECNIMLDIGDHPNVVKLIGVAVQQVPWLCVLDFQQYGDLRAVMLACKQKGIVCTTMEQAHIMTQLASGCGAIAKKRMVHMDLAARNVLVGDTLKCKIADFGLTHKMSSEGDWYHMKQRIPLAMKWMSPEALENLFFSEFSDVWSLGVVFWEILAYGAFPLGKLKNAEVIGKLKEGIRLQQPSSTPDALWSIIEKCWSYKPDLRPKFSVLEQQFTGYQATLPQGSNLRDIGKLCSR